MYLGGVAKVGRLVVVDVVEVPLLLVGGSVSVLVLVLDLLAVRITVVGEQLGYQHPGRIGLGCRLLLLGLGLLLLLLLLGCAGLATGTSRSRRLIRIVVRVFFVLGVVAVRRAVGGLVGRTRCGVVDYIRRWGATRRP